MNVREYLNNNSALVTIAAVALLVISLGLIILNNRGNAPGGVVDVYYFDLNTQKLVVAPSDRLSPFDGGSGTFAYPDGEHGSVVRAMVFACGECEGIRPDMSLAELEAAGGFIGYLQIMTQRARELQERSQAGEELTEADFDIMYSQGNLIADVSGQRWFPEMSDQAMRIMDQASQRCAGQPIQACLP